MSHHGPARLRNYISIHDAHMGQLFKQGFARHDSLSLEVLGVGPDGKRTAYLSGCIACVGNIVICVQKTLDILGEEGDPDPFVQTWKYAYQAHRYGMHELLRHDNAPHHDHQDEHHFHEFEWDSGEELEGSPFWCGAPNWPTLYEFVMKVANIYYAKGCALPGAFDCVDDLSAWTNRLLVDRAL